MHRAGGGGEDPGSQVAFLQDLAFREHLLWGTVVGFRDGGSIVVPVAAMTALMSLMLITLKIVTYLAFI